ncbi:sensor histidine kinase [Aliikangiella coralliicola]|uniref:histidine kinase n=1 Tax=Aliikangiella coralliicola TaxID=2592383 RepID=A0A545TS24_9GAMM|nr:ATP-binding protein [Aliikangiella coralliicola]TQV80019.1 hypothetical protein FLL46_26795 [Aliikangiella coralliicola]
MITTDFERDYTLKELIPSNRYSRIANALSQFGFDYFEIIDLDQSILFSQGKSSNIESLPLILELEAIGHFQYDQENKSIAQAASNMLIEILQANWRYHMASSLHVQVSQEDYHALKLKNEQLEDSEQRYKNLADQLEQRVKKQVKVIEASQRKLYEAEKMASIGQLAAGIAHEINNPIGFISSNLNTASEYIEELALSINDLLHKEVKPVTESREKLPEEELLDDFQELVGESINGAKRIARIVSDLKAYSNVELAQEQLVNLTENIELAKRIFLSSTDKSININIRQYPIEPTYCKPSHINQLLLNLLNNASDAMGSEGEISILCQMKNNDIFVEVTDNGCGINEEDVKHVFEPFFTTKDVGSGTGLGLTVCQDIIRAHDGSISLSSKIGLGTSVKILLPIKNTPTSNE